MSFNIFIKSSFRGEQLDLMDLNHVMLEKNKGFNDVFDLTAVNACMKISFIIKLVSYL